MVTFTTQETRVQAYGSSSVQALSGTKEQHLRRVDGNPSLTMVPPGVCGVATPRSVGHAVVWVHRQSNSRTRREQALNQGLRPWIWKELCGRRTNSDLWTNNKELPSSRCSAPRRPLHSWGARFGAQLWPKSLRSLSACTHISLQDQCFLNLVLPHVLRCKRRRRRGGRGEKGGRGPEAIVVGVLCLCCVCVGFLLPTHALHCAAKSAST